jgi:hypothetical protein
MRKEYINPSLDVFEVASENGYANSTGGLTFGGGTSDGWYGTY